MYRARDTRLMRDAAIKVLPPAFTDYRERLERFEREAQLLARLHHPNIASVFGLEESTGVLALVMELVEGEDLSTRIARGPIPLDEALPIATQIAAALEVAHEHGIIHRDLKPANVKVRTDGAVKVLDFGLAKALAPDASASADVNVAHSPTLTVGDTRVGTILGTAAYMAPEQARGRAVDRRADIWAFGLVLYEMLTGRRAFAGRTARTSSPQSCARRWTGRRCPPARRRRCSGCSNVVSIATRDGACATSARRASCSKTWRTSRATATIASGPPADVPSPGRAKAARPLAVAAAVAVLALGFAIGRVADGFLGSTPASGAPPIAFERLTFQPGHFVDRPLCSRRTDGLPERCLERRAGNLPGAAAGRRTAGRARECRAALRVANGGACASAATRRNGQSVREVRHAGGGVGERRNSA